jgi:hypothetical protein
VSYPLSPGVDPIDSIGGIEAGFQLLGEGALITNIGTADSNSLS